MIRTSKQVKSRRFMALGLAVAAAVGASPSRLAADALSNWTWRNPAPTGETIADLAYGEGSFVAVDRSGKIYASPDGRRWVREQVTGTDPLNAVVPGAGRFVAVGQRGRVVTRAGGVWTERSAGTTQALVAVTFGNGAFVAVGAAGTIIRSTDGVSWAVQSVGPTRDLTGVSFGSGVFVAAGGDRSALVSTDGTSWEPHVISGFPVGYVSGPVARTFDRFTTTMLVSTLGVVHWTPYESSDGVHWDVSASLANGTSGLDAASDGATTVLTRLFGGASGATVLVSSNGSTWNPVAVAPSGSVTTVAYGQGIFVAGGSSGLLARSTDGEHWEVVRRGYSDLELSAAVAGDGGYVLVGTTLCSSTNLENFVRSDGYGAQPAFPQAFMATAWGQGVYVAGGAGGRIVRTTNGVDWSTAVSGFTGQIRGIAYGAGKFVAVGSGGNIRTSSDGKTWQSASSGISTFLTSIAYQAGKFVVVGSGGTVLTSVDGRDWHLEDSGVSSSLLSVVYGNGRFVSVGYKDVNGANRASVIESADGATWVELETDLAVPLQNVAYGGGVYLAASGTGVTSAGSVGVYASADGRAWWRVNYGSDAKTSGVAFVNNTFLLLGAAGTVLQSDPLGGLYLALRRATAPDTGLVFNLTGGEIGQRYELQESSSWPGEWTPVGSVVQSQYTSQLTVPNSTALQRFFRATKVTAP